FLNPPIKSSPESMKNTLLTQRYVDEGYYVAGAGKIMHGKENQTHIPNYAGSYGGFGPLPKKKIAPFKGHKLWDWGAFPEKDEDMPDFKTAAWGINQLSKKHETPFFLATGFFRPHVPQYAPQKWFDMYPLDEVQLPKTKTGDLKNISQYATNITRLEHIAPTQEWVTKNNQWKPLVQSYLACVSFVDAQVGKVIKALEASPYKDNTYIVLYSDHGFHLGEKERWAKRSLWEDGARVPMIIVGPGIAPGQVCNKPVQLLDIYPTLLELTGHKADSKLEGNSLVPLLKNPNADWPHMARTSFGPENYAIISEQFRYIHYNDGSEEFYDHKKDPHEWDNQINNPEYLSAIKAHRKHKPTSFHKVLGSGSTGHKSFKASGIAK
ncbi:MAG: sulfatase, partial [Lentisphaeraceae bacterium]|nr:sulfatase [Lentisphaeraceae bacterium]